jgi:hypothetical protein
MARLGDVDQDGDTIMADWVGDEGSVSSQKSPLLELPGELRNKIYEYALTEDTTTDDHDTTWFRITPGIHAVPGTYVYPGIIRVPIDQDRSNIRVGPSMVGQDGEVNQLKYVCRQLRGETKCLEVRLCHYKVSTLY